MKTETKTRTSNITFPRRRTALTKKEQAEAAVRKFEDAQRAVLEFMEDNEELFEVFMELTEEYNTQLAEARGAIRQVESERSFQIGPFNRAKDSTEVEGYDPRYMPNRILNMEGVVKSIDTKTVDALLASGKIKFEDVKDAKTKSPGRTPSLRGPKDITLNP